MEEKAENTLSEKIVLFLKKSTNLTLATSINNIPYCANCFYAYDAERNLLIFKSDRETHHIEEALLNNKVAGTVLPDKLDSKKIKGIQFSGIFIDAKDELLDSFKKIYYRKYPFALTFAGEIWAVELTNIKMTDNTLGFGKKIHWKK